MNTYITNELKDEQLVSRAQQGDLQAFETLTTRYEQRVYSLAFRMLRQEQDAEDVTQQTFLSALENLKGFRGEASFSTWLLRIATHAALKIIRKRKGLPTVSLDAPSETAESEGDIPHPEYIADWRHSPEELVQKHPGWRRSALSQWRSSVFSKRNGLWCIPDELGGLGPHPCDVRTASRFLIVAAPAHRA